MSFRAWMISCLTMFCAAAEPFSYDQRPEVKAFIQELAKFQKFDEKELSKLFASVHKDSRVLPQAAPPQAARVKNWRSYRARFLDRAIVKAGKAFWRQNAKVLAQAEREYGVPAEIIVGILGVETNYGRNMGQFPVLDTLTTLAFDYPAEAPNREARAMFFRQQLSDYIIWCRDTRQDVHAFTGSYAGAIGMPQFLPGSIRAYGVDFDKDGHVDLRGNAVDAIGSVAHFLQKHGWERGRPVLWKVGSDARSRKVLEAKGDGDPGLKHRLGDLLEAGLKPLVSKSVQMAEKDTKVLLVDLPTPNRPAEYRIGFRNFYAITRYNRSFFYAMSVAELGQAVKSVALRSVPKPVKTPAPRGSHASTTGG